MLIRCLVQRTRTVAAVAPPNPTPTRQACCTCNLGNLAQAHSCAPNRPHVKAHRCHRAAKDPTTGRLRVPKILGLDVIVTKTTPEGLVPGFRLRPKNLSTSGSEGSGYHAQTLRSPSPKLPALKSTS